MRFVCLVLCSTWLCTVANATFISATPPEHLARTGANPLDDDHCPAQLVTALPIAITGNTTNSAFDYPINCSYGGNDDIYAIQLACETQVTVNLCNSEYDTSVEIRRGPTSSYDECPGNVLITCNDNSTCGFLSLTDFQIGAGEVFFIIVSGASVWDSGPYLMNLTGVPCDVLDAPESLTITFSGNNILLDWNAVLNASQYHVYRTSEYPVEPILDNLIATTGTSSYTDSGVLSGPFSKHFYIVTAE